MPLMFLSLDETPLPPALEERWLGELPAERHRQLRTWPDAAARRRSLLGSRLLREGLQRLGHVAEALASLRYPAHGKPTLDLSLDFSLAHCEGRIVCALSTEGPVGVDIEPLGTVRAADVALYLSARERAWAGDDARRFCTLWTRKEAVVKAAGGGLRQMREFEMRDERAEFAGQLWHTVPVDVGPDFVAHLALAQPLAAPLVIRIPAEMLY